MIYISERLFSNFNGFTESLLAKAPGIKGLVWVARVDVQDRNVIEANASKESGQPFFLKELSEGQFVPALMRDRHFPVLYAQPPQENTAAIGFDLASNPARLEALEKAAKTNSMQASSRIEIIQAGKENSAGVLILAPVFSSPTPLSADERWAKVRGFAVAVVQVSMLIEDAVRAKHHPELAISLADVSIARQEPLYSRGSPSSVADLIYRHDLDLGGRIWRLQVSPAQEFMDTYHSLRSWRVLAGGLLLIGLLQVYFLDFSGQETRTRNLVLERTRSLEVENHNRLKVEAKLHESRATLQAVIDTVVDGIITIDEVGTMIHANPAAERLFGHALADMVGRNVSMLMPNPYHAEHDGYLARYMKEGQPRVIGIGREVTGMRQDGSTFPMELAVAEARLGDRRLFTGVVRDISLKRQAETDLKLAASVFHDTMEGVLIADGEGRIITVNPAFTAITGYTAEDVIGKNPNVLKSDRHDEAFYRNLWNTLMDQGRFQGEMWNRRKSGEAFMIWQSISMVCDDRGNPVRFVAVFKDVTDIRRDDERIRHFAFHDTLTGLPNRLLLNDRLEHALSVARRDMSPLAVMFLDLDGFKVVNDTMGHDVGDELLQEVANRLTHAVRQTDTVARLGGDEFVVILEAPSGLEEVIYVADRIIETVNVPMTIKGHVAKVGTSVGIALFPHHGEDREALLQNADGAMYRAKKGGKNAYRLHEQEMV